MQGPGTDPRTRDCSCMIYLRLTRRRSVSGLAGRAGRRGQTGVLPVRYNGRKDLCRLVSEASRDRSRVKTQDVARRYEKA